MGSGEFFTVPCYLVISAVGEQVDDARMAANGIELDKNCLLYTSGLGHFLFTGE